MLTRQISSASFTEHQQTGAAHLNRNETLLLGSAGEAPLLDSSETVQSAEQAKAEAEQAQLDGIVKILEEFTEESNSGVIHEAAEVVKAEVSTDY